MLEGMQDVAVLKTYLEQHLPAGLELLREMVGINSFTGNPEGVNRLGRFTAQCFAPLGFQAQFVPSTNPAWGKHLVMVRPGRSGKSIALISHLDTVFPPEDEARNNFRWQREGDRIFGPGTVDIKGGTVMMWLVLWALRQHAPEVFEAISWKLIWNSSEEAFSPDFEQACRSRFDAATLAALVFEAEEHAGQESLLVTGRKGRGAWRVTATGRAAHAGGRHPHGANAIVQLGLTLQRIAALTDYSRDLTFNVGTISGGTVVNRVPHAATAEGEYRAFLPQVCAQARESLLALNGPGEVRSPADGYACHVKVEIVEEWRPWPPNAATDRLCQFWTQAGAQLGLRVGGQARGGSATATASGTPFRRSTALGPGVTTTIAPSAAPTAPNCPSSFPPPRSSPRPP